MMQRIAAPMIGGMVTAPLLSMLVIPHSTNCYINVKYVNCMCLFRHAVYVSSDYSRERDGN